MKVHTWANGFGVWHARINADTDNAPVKAGKAIREELIARGDVGRFSPVNIERVEELDLPGTVVYREV